MVSPVTLWRKQVRAPAPFALLARALAAALSVLPVERLLLLLLLEGAVPRCWKLLSEGSALTLLDKAATCMVGCHWRSNFEPSSSQSFSNSNILSSRTANGNAKRSAHTPASSSSDTLKGWCHEDSRVTQFAK
jgi:hypothetical protein